MRKGIILIIAIIIGLLILSLSITTCPGERTTLLIPKDQMMKNTVSPTGDYVAKEFLSNRHNQPTSEPLAAHFPGEKIISQQPVGRNLLLIETQKEPFAHRFIVYDTSDAKKYLLPTSDYDVSIGKIIDENHIDLNVSGKRTEVPIREFPFILHCRRTDNRAEFSATFEPMLFRLGESVEGGSPKTCILSELSADGGKLRIPFEPVPGKEADFYAGSVSIPVVRTRFNPNNQQLIVELENVQTSATQANRPADMHMPLVSRFEIIHQNTSTDLQLSLKETVDRYSVSTGTLIRNARQLPYVELEIFCKQP